MQNAFVAEGGVIEVAASRAIVPTVNRMAAGCRDLGVPVIWIRSHHPKVGADWRHFFDHFVHPDRKDAAAVSEIAGVSAAQFQALLRAAGPAEAALAALGAMALVGAAAEEVARLIRVVESIQAGAPDLTLTIDPAEHRGFEYQTGISFILFARGVRGELGRGGRYATEPPARAATGDASPEPESATGFTLFMDSVQRALPEPLPPRRLYLPPDCPAARGNELRAEGWITLAGLEAVADFATEARRMGCSHALIEGAITALED